MSALDEYSEKRDFLKTKEPKPEYNPESVLMSFVSRKLGEFISGDMNRVMVINTENHPLAYAEFQGEIPEGEYGGGEMEIVDGGTYETIEKTDDKWQFWLEGSRLNGLFTLVKMDPKKYGEDKWMLTRNKEQ